MPQTRATEGLVTGSLGVRLTSSHTLECGHACSRALRTASGESSAREDLPKVLTMGL